MATPAILSLNSDIIMDTDARVRMTGQNRVRYLNALVSCTKSADQTGLTNSAWTTVTFDTEAFDTDGMHDNATNNSRLTVAIAGKYLVTGTVYVDDTNIVGSQLAGARFIKNGGTTEFFGLHFENTSTAIPGAILTVTSVVSLAASDYMEMQAFCAGGGGGTFDVFKGGPTTRFGMMYIGE